MIDTIEISKHLHKAGFPVKQSNALAQEFYKITDAQLSKLATKEQLEDLKKEIGKFATKEQLNALEERIVVKIDSLSSQIKMMMWAIGLLIALPYLGNLTNVLMQIFGK